MRAKLSAESSGGGGSPAVNVTEPIEPKTPTVTPPAVVPRPPAPEPAPPPAATTVSQGEITEETLKLQAALDSERAARRKVEQDHASVTDEFSRYKDATEARRAIPIPVRKKGPEDKPFRIGRFF